MAIVDTFIQLGFLLENRVMNPLVKPFETELLNYLMTNHMKATLKVTRWMQHFQHPSSRQLPLMNPLHVVALCLAYLAVVFVGKFVMSFREKMQPKLFANVHNAFLLSLSGYMFVNIMYQAFGVHGYALFDNPKESDTRSFELSKHLWLFYFSKIFEFVDTFIMVVKKNNRQISFLHVYHHTSIFTVWWFVIFLAPYGEAYFSAALNSFIHVVMYGYYLCSSLNIGRPVMSRIKPYITMMQMTQFSLMMVQATYDVVVAKFFTDKKDMPSKYPVMLTTLLWFYMWTMLGLFANFFIQNYMKKAASKKAEIKEASKEE